jgi:hypothetical protein
MATKLTRLTHKIAMQLYLVAESCTICSSRSRLPVRKLLDTPSYTQVKAIRYDTMERYPLLSYAPRHEDVWGSGSVTPCILNLVTRLKYVVSHYPATLQHGKSPQ